MALEISRLLPRYTQILDVGCGNGFIAHHLQGLLNARVVGLDIGAATSSNIEYLSYDGRHFPVNERTFDAVLLCYVLHHAADAGLVLNEVGRVLRHRGLVVIYEDIPCSWVDRAACWIHNRQWQGRSGPCTFRINEDWKETFSSAGFEILLERRLSRWRNLAHPVSRQFYLLRSIEELVQTRMSERTSSANLITEEILVTA
jgi:ubiquinone/menaquinone biosynthesis C-methylase UbiE